MAKENDIEKAFIDKLQTLHYTYRQDIHNAEARNNNFRIKFNTLNKVTLTDNEFSRLLEQVVSPDVFDVAKRLRSINTFEREDGTPLNYKLMDTENWCKNSFEVVKQQHSKTKDSYHRYDVLLLINGLPVVQIELKSFDVSPREAMQQIVLYKNDPENGYTNSLLCFIQFFVVSNNSNTWYFANNNMEHFNFNADERFLPTCKFADEKNKKITGLDEFTEKFFPKSLLGEMIYRYMVLVECEQKLLMMRSYQIYAVKNILSSIEENRGNGYIWHTTGSGKTLTSFKASTLLKKNDNIAKCLFVVDRKDLDRQTREEFNKFQPGCVEENTNTSTLVKRLLSTSYEDKVIVTTIQKLGLALKPSALAKGKQNKNSQQEGTSYVEQLKPLKDKRIVFIFDECHRSQFGENHKAIKEFFPKSQLFGFTGTPIFEKNANLRQVEGQDATLLTTEDVFEKELHAYTITHAIEDNNVLRFRVDYYDAGADNKESSLELSKPSIVKAILKNHDTTTANRKFNAIFATSSINDAIEYYNLFQEYNIESPLNIACVFSPPAEGNQDVRQLQEDLLQEKEDYNDSPEKTQLKKEALKQIIQDYNKYYGTNYNIYEFDSYYKDVQQRIKDHKYSNADYPHSKKIDIIIVVDMLLTGFDSSYLNTLYVDKNLKYHALIQAFSRTNRVLNDTKPYGNIIDFRRQETNVDDAITLFSGGKGEQSRKIWLVEDVATVLNHFQDAVHNLEKFMESRGLECEAAEISNLKGDATKAEFINHFREVQRLKTRIEQYTDFTEEQQQEMEETMPKDELRSFKSMYLETVKQLQEPKEGKPPLENPPDYELVLFASTIIDYDYIMSLIAKLTQSTEKESMTREAIIELINSDAKFMNDREDIVAFVYSIKLGEAKTEEEIRQGFAEFKNNKVWQNINVIADTFKLSHKSIKDFVDDTVQRRILDSDMLVDLFTPLGLHWKERGDKEVELIKTLKPYLYKLTHDREISGIAAYEE